MIFVEKNTLPSKSSYPSTSIMQSWRNCRKLSSRNSKKHWWIFIIFSGNLHLSHKMQLLLPFWKFVFSKIRRYFSQFPDFIEHWKNFFRKRYFFKTFPWTNGMQYWQPCQKNAKEPNAFFAAQSPNMKHTWKSQLVAKWSSGQAECRFWNPVEKKQERSEKFSRKSQKY